MTFAYTYKGMAAINTVLCLHRAPDQLRYLREKGLGLVTATNGSEGLRLLSSRPVDAVVLEDSPRELNDAAMVDEIRRLRPRIPIVLVPDLQELSGKALKSVDTVVARSDGPLFLRDAVHFLLITKPDAGWDRC